MELARWQGARSSAAFRRPSLVAIAVALAVSLMAACGPAESVTTDMAAAEAPSDAGTAAEPAAVVDAIDVAPEVLADELRDAAVQALALPDPIVEVAPNADGEVSLGVANSWETLDLTIRSVEETPTEVVVFASPVRAEWELGDGNALRCDEFGSLDSVGECVHTYPQHGRFEGAIELVWGLSWSLDGVHQGIFETTSTGASFVVTR